MITGRNATLSIHGEAPVPVAVLTPTHGNDCLDIRTLGGRSGRFAYDSGFESTASCKSKITFIDGEKGELLHYGYPIEQLAEQCDFLEVAYLLKNGELPNAAQKQCFESAIRKQASVHEQMVKFYQGFRRDARPMAVMVGVVGAFSAFHHDAADFSDAERRKLSFLRIVARMPTIVAMAYKYSIGEPFMSPRPDLSYTANFLYMMFGTPRETYRPNPLLVRALDRLFIMHAENGQDAATSTVRMAGSSGANPFACVAAAIACLSGPAHAGASEACLAMLEAIGDVARLAEFVARARNDHDSLRRIGFGHPVYTNFDPRTRLLREVCDALVQELGLENQPLFQVAKALEKTALEDPYFVENKLYPNVDFYSAIVQKALGIPASMFACIFALARTAGWMAQWEEMLGDPEYKIARPRQLYTGVNRRNLPSPA
ncbi:MAG: citrate synthase [Candidatus Accumulibacter phosphatis]|jgi:citrate synthase|uniref:Citrate synthase n=1 Tax=Candidatus Accumulibacter contiguus TaxID=2954381 RepID=A0ABX1T9Y2_9PROT|nr:citrate synthase [Candidatus Accumulibacter contiguus]MBL8406810.1 citrate (Si)-synthase [Accumulibacter sp.]NMQ06487.1 citrate (Si)-synthase [Candidatus Accumulibacter contiguus]HCZ16083.1 citrate (Si)-synthase [Accumulibacter sp.]HRF10792.1 citrate synthase [Candidatus Accumulibacter phosphatis]